MNTPPSEHVEPRDPRIDAAAVVRTLTEAGFIAYFAGGCVRDELMGLTPADYDVATSAAPQQVRKIFRSTQAVGAAFGVILVRQRSSVIEVATFRSDGAYHDGRHPSEVCFSTPLLDAQRRDFTINAMFYDPQQSAVIDFVGGQSDLQARLLRAVGDPELRFAEDQLRLLRAIRFAARFDFAIESATAQAMRRQAGKLIGISPERIADELRAMFEPSTRGRAIALLHALRLLDIIFRFAPPADADPGGRSILASLGAEPAPFALCMAAASLERRADLSALTPAWISTAQSALRKALRWSNQEADVFIELLQSAARVIHPDKLTLAKKRRLVALATAPSLLRLLKALAATGRAVIPSALIDELAALAGQPAPPPLVSGDDLASAGFSPGPMFRVVLEAVYDAQLESAIQTREDAVALAIRLASRSAVNRPSSG